MDLDELIASIKKHFGGLFEKHGFTISKAYQTGQYGATMPVILKSGPCKIRFQAEMGVGLALGIKDSDDQYLGYCPEKHWWSADSLDAFLDNKTLDPWMHPASVSDEGIAELADRFEKNLETMIEMMRSPQNWQEDFNKFYKLEAKSYHRRVGLVKPSWLWKVWMKGANWWDKISLK